MRREQEEQIQAQEDPIHVLKISGEGVVVDPAGRHELTR